MLRLRSRASTVPKDFKQNSHLYWGKVYLAKECKVNPIDLAETHLSQYSSSPSHYRSTGISRPSPTSTSSPSLSTSWSSRHFPLSRTSFRQARSARRSGRSASANKCPSSDTHSTGFTHTTSRVPLRRREGSSSVTRGSSHHIAYSFLIGSSSFVDDRSF